MPQRAISAPEVQGQARTRLQRVQELWRARRERKARERAEIEAAAAIGGHAGNILGGAMSQHLVSRRTEPNLGANSDFRAMMEDGSAWQPRDVPTAGVAGAKQFRLYGGLGALWYNTAHGAHLRERAPSAPEEHEDPSCEYQQMADDAEERPLPAHPHYELIRSGASLPTFGNHPAGVKAPTTPNSPDGVRQRNRNAKQDWYQQMED